MTRSRPRFLVQPRWGRGTKSASLKHLRGLLSCNHKQQYFKRTSCQQRRAQTEFPYPPKCHRLPESCRGGLRTSLIFGTNLLNLHVLALYFVLSRWAFLKTSTVRSPPPHESGSWSYLHFLTSTMRKKRFETNPLHPVDLEIRMTTPTYMFIGILLEHV